MDATKRASLGDSPREAASGSRRARRGSLKREKQRAEGGAEQVARLSEALAREKGRSDAAAQELGGLRAELAALRKDEAGLAEVSAVVESERRRANAAVAEVALLKSEQAKLLAKGADLDRAAQREKQRADAAARELAALKQDPGSQEPVSSKCPVPVPPRPRPQEPSAGPSGDTTGGIERSAKPAFDLSPSRGQDVPNNRGRRPKVHPAETAKASKADARRGATRANDLGEASFELPNRLLPRWGSGP